MTRLSGLGHVIIVRMALPCLLLSQTPPAPSPGGLLEDASYVRIPAGEFSMGSVSGNADEQPINRVRIPRSFEMGKYEVTQAQWDSIMRNPHGVANAKERAADVNPSQFKGPSRPVESVSWDLVQFFIRALNSRDPKHTYRLPTEAEWEYAARAGSTEDSPKDLDAIAWHLSNSGEETHPVGEKAPNAWGLYDMLGNVFEWVQDWYVSRSYEEGTTPDSAAASSGSYRVYRGCGWSSERKYCRPAFRAFNFPSQGQFTVGFRLVRTPK